MQSEMTCQELIQGFFVFTAALHCMLQLLSFKAWMPSLNTQFRIKGLLVTQDFCFWAVWAAKLKLC